MGDGGPLYPRDPGLQPKEPLSRSAPADTGQETIFELKQPFNESADATFAARAFLTAVALKNALAKSPPTLSP
ncbi:hypothetical protein EVAR_19643_1 [Eumeta japonica]|uniref:Uncharacterized protein n=1 Tax=Eumeta variegata TaxID=151549 RepID=A0A4C1UG81_EUMVA|nr:hypothetical protein EVAR_19643_1 [Eumeta japonica]